MKNQRKNKPDFLKLLNTALSGVVLLYAISVEHRLTDMETKMNLLLRDANIVLPDQPARR